MQKRILYFFTFCTLSFFFSECNNQTPKTLEQKANAFNNKYYVQLLNYRNLLFSEYFKNIDTTNYTRLRLLTNDSCYRGHDFVLNKDIDFDSILLRNINFSEQLLFQKIRFHSQVDTHKVAGFVVGEALKDRVTFKKGYEHTIYWCSNRLDYCNAEKIFIETLKRDYEQEWIRIEDGLVFFLYTHKQTKVQIIGYDIEQFFKDSKQISFPIDIHIYLALPNTLE